MEYAWCSRWHLIQRPRPRCTLAFRTTKHLPETYSPAEKPGAADATLRLPVSALPLLAAGEPDAATLTAAGIEVTGDTSALGRLFAVLDDPDPDFAIVTP
ncbi:MAG: alkyl sulfatase C-terminal domain-containing protein [Frankiaceae bacterium]